MFKKSIKAKLNVIGAFNLINFLKIYPGQIDAVSTFEQFG